jgi:hypothetical protein
LEKHSISSYAGRIGREKIKFKINNKKQNIGSIREPVSDAWMQGPTIRGILNYRPHKKKKKEKIYIYI